MREPKDWIEVVGCDLGADRDVPRANPAARATARGTGPLSTVEDCLAAVVEAFKLFDLRVSSGGVVESRTLTLGALEVGFSRGGKTRAGVCRYSPSTRLCRIELNGVAWSAFSPEHRRSTLMHEAAHAIEFLQHGTSDHGLRWKKIAQRLGCTGDRCMSDEQAHTMRTAWAEKKGLPPPVRKTQEQVEAETAEARARFKVGDEVWFDHKGRAAYGRLTAKNDKTGTVFLRPGELGMAMGGNARVPWTILNLAAPRAPEKVAGVGKPAPGESLAAWKDRTGARSNPSDDITQTEAFKRWFKDSKVVDRAGKPLVVYHGTPDARGLFGADGSGKKGFRASWRGAAFFATDDYRTAASYADPKRAFDYQNAEAAVLPLFLSIQNPLVIDAGFQHWRGTEGAVEQARAGGHDGVIIHNSVDHYNVLRSKPPKRKDASTVFVFFDPTQAKSAAQTSRLSWDGPNDGTFDVDDPDLRSNPGDGDGEVERHLLRFDGGVDVAVDVGDAHGFADDAGSSVVMSSLDGKVAWLEWIGAAEKGRGHGSRALRALLSDLQSRGVVAVGMQAVDVDGNVGSPKHERLIRWYKRFGFEDASHLAPWADYPVMLKVFDDPDLRSNPAVDEEAPFFHVTSFAAMEEIARRGLQPRQGGGVFSHGGYGEHSQGKVFFGQGKDAALAWYGKVQDMLWHEHQDDEEPDGLVPVLLRVDSDALPEDPQVDPIGDRDVPGSFFVTKRVPPSSIWYWCPRERGWFAVKDWDGDAYDGVKEVEFFDENGDVVDEAEATSRGFHIFEPWQSGGFKPDRDDPEAWE